MRPGTASLNKDNTSNNTTLPRVSTAPARGGNSNNNNNPQVSFGQIDMNSNNTGGGFETLDFLSGNNNNNNNSSSLDFNSMATGNGERTPLSSAIENASNVVKSCEANVSSLTERLTELQQNLIKCKQMENEMVPREAETKSTVSSFQRLVDVGTKIKKGAKKRGGGGGDGSNAAGNDDDSVSESQASRSEAATAVNEQHNNSNSTSNKRFGLNLLAGKDDMTKEELADRDAVRLLSHKIRHILTPVFSEIFFQDSTGRETQKAAYIQQQADEQAAREALLANAAASGSGAEKSTRASRRAQQQLQQQQQQAMQQQQQAGGKGGAGGGGPATFNPLFDRLDPDLYLIPGVDPSFFQDLLNLRQTRLTAERALKKTQEQFSTAQSIVAKRRSDGSNKSALRKAEKQLQQAQAGLRELQRQKEEREIRRRLEAAAADANSSATNQQQFGSSGVDHQGGRGTRKSLSSSVRRK